MKFGVVVDGQAESQALKVLFRQVSVPKCQILNPAYADMQPKASAGQIVRAAAPKLQLLRTRGAHAFLLLIDFEDRSGCIVDFAGEIRSELESRGWDKVYVIGKNRRFENWLIADVDALSSMPKRMEVTAAFRRRVAPNKADSVQDAVTLLNSIAVGRPYHKRDDAVQICAKQDPLRIASNSRSFRRLLHTVGHPMYRDQSIRIARSRSSRRLRQFDAVRCVPIHQSV